MDTISVVLVIVVPLAAPKEVTNTYEYCEGQPNKQGEECEKFPAPAGIAGHHFVEEILEPFAEPSTLLENFQFF